MGSKLSKSNTVKPVLRGQLWDNEKVVYRKKKIQSLAI
jgi:hypothetical protein